MIAGTNSRAGILKVGVHGLSNWLGDSAGSLGTVSGCRVEP